MKYLSTGNTSLRIPFKEAVITGISEDGGLYLPAEIPVLPAAFFRNMNEMSLEDISYVVLSAFLSEDFSSEKLRDIISSVLTFQLPVIPLDGNKLFVAELFHGPTGSGKDLSVRFMAHIMESLFENSHGKINLVTSVSSDYGAAIADAFSNSDRFKNILIYQKGELSTEIQTKNTNSDKTLMVIEVRGSKLESLAAVRSLLSDKGLRNSTILSTADSINISYLLPLVIQYFHICARMISNGAEFHELVFAVPSGNLEDVSALLIAAEMGLPVKRIIALSSDSEEDNPINKPRVEYLLESSKIPVSTVFISKEKDEQSADFQREYEYKFDASSAKNAAALLKDLRENESGVFLATSSPVKKQRDSGTHFNHIPISPTSNALKRIILTE